MGEVERSMGKLAEEINAQHRACETAVGAALEHAMNAGDLLLEAKDKAPHGSWQEWLAGNFEGSVRTAQTYMSVAARRGEVEAAKTQSSAPLSLDGALKALSTPKDAPQPARPATLEELEERVEEALSRARAHVLGVAESLDAIRRTRGWEHLGYASFADYVTGHYGTRYPGLPITYEVISDEAGEPLGVFEMAESLHAFGVALQIEPLLRESEEE